MIPGEIFPASGEIVLNKDRAAISLTVANTGDRPIQVGSHYQRSYVTCIMIVKDRKKVYL